MTTPSEILATARRLADDVFFPAALATDASELLPVEHLNLLAQSGFYGLTGPVESGGLNMDSNTVFQVAEILAGGCLTTAFVWRQHLGVVTAVANSSAKALRAEWLADLCAGRKRSGIALAGTWAGPPILTARQVEGGWVIDGRAPWVSGWGRTDVVLVSARDVTTNNVVRMLVDAVESANLHAEPLQIVAVQASGTVDLGFGGLFVPEERVVAIEPYKEWSALDAKQLRLNGAHSTGLAARCCALLGPTALDDELTACRRALEAPTEETIAAARARASELAMRAAAAYVSAVGSRSVLMDQHAQRLAREAVFLLAFGQRPAIRAALLEQFGAAPQIRG